MLDYEQTHGRSNNVRRFVNFMIQGGLSGGQKTIPYSSVDEVVDALQSDTLQAQRLTPMSLVDAWEVFGLHFNEDNSIDLVNRFADSVADVALIYSNCLDNA